MKRLAYFIATVIVLGFVGLAVSNIQQQKQLNQNLDIQLDQKEIRLKELQQQSLELHKQLDKEKSSTEQDQKKIDELQQQIEQLEKDLQAKLQREEAERVAQQKLQEASNRATGTATAYASGGNKDTWLAQSGIPESDWWAVDTIVSRESGWNPLAVNPSSGACGLAQQLPCGKWPGDWRDPVLALKNQHNYVNARYGGYPQAVAFWNANHWY